MKIKIIKKSHTKYSGKKLKSRIKHSVSNHMKKRHSKKSKSSGGGKIFGKKIPVIGGLINNPTVSKVAKAAGTVAIVGAAVQLVNNPQLNSIWGNQLVRSGVAYASGDFIGAAGTYVLENPQLLNRVSSGVSQQSMVGYA